MDQFVNEIRGLALGTVLTVDNADWFNKTPRCLALQEAGFWATTITPDQVTLRKDLPPGRYLC